MAKLRVPITDIQTGKTVIKVYEGDVALLEKLRREILTDRKAYKPPGTAIHTPTPVGVAPREFIASFLVKDPIQIVED